MKSVGEAMAIGRSFVEALQKAMRSLEQSPSQFWVHPTRPALPQDALDRARVRTTCGC
jgi:carbamoyl-phosphate synthase large subunit